MDTRTRIIHGANELFQKSGIRAITMDDISRHLGMSKKTLYLHFKDKNDIVVGVVEDHFKSEERDCIRMHSNAIDPVHESILVMRWSDEVIKSQNPVLIYEVRKYHPEAWAKFHDFKYNFVYGIMKENLEKGVSEGLYRPEINVNMIARMRMEMIELPFNPAAFPPDQFNMVHVQHEIFLHFLHGLVTEKGRQLIEKYLLLPGTINTTSVL